MANLGSISAATTKPKNATQPNHPRLDAGGASILTKKLRERDLGRDLKGAKITLNEYLDRWFHAAVKPRVRQKAWQDMTVSCGGTSGPAWATEFWSQCAQWTFKPPTTE